MWSSVRDGGQKLTNLAPGVVVRASQARRLHLLVLLLLFCQSAYATVIFRGSFEPEGRTPVAAALVELRGADGTVKAATNTDAWGAFPAFAAAQLAAGDVIVVFGGSWDDAPFVGELRSPVDSPAVVQTVGPITTLVVAVANSDLVTSAPPGRLVNAVNLLTDRGLIDADWRSGSPARVDDDLAAQVVAGGGMQTWVAALVADLSDGDLDRAWMVSFPHVHGGVAGIDFDPSAGEWLRGDAIELALEVEHTLPPPVAGYSFSKQSGPDWVSVSPGGVVTANVPADAANGFGNLVIRVLNPEAGRFRDVTLSYQVLIGTVVAQATYGATGGTLWLPDNSLGLEVPDNAFSAPTVLEWVRYGEGDATRHRMRTTPRDRAFLLAPTLLTPALRGAGSPPPDCTQVTGWGEGWYVRANCKNARFAEAWIHTGGSPVKVVALNRLPNGPSRPLPANQSYQLSTSPEQLAWVMGSRCNTDCLGKIPVLYVHGYLQGGEIGGGYDTWGELPNALHGQTAPGGGSLAAYQFRYRSNGRFQDLAEDLQTAVEAIHSETGEKVHIVAHSFGGLVARTYLQRLIPGTPDIQPPPGNCTTSRHPQVASLTTLGTPHSGVAGEDEMMHGRLLPSGRHGWAGGGMWVCQQSSCWQAGVPRPFANAAVFRESFGVEAQPGFIPARLADFGNTYPLPVPTLSLIGLMPDGTSFADGDNLISYMGQRFAPQQSCSGTCSSTTVVRPAITQIGSTELGHCLYERVLGTVVNNAAPLPGISRLRAQTLQPTYGHSSAVVVGSHAYEAEISQHEAGNGDLRLATHDTVQRLRDWLLRLREPDPAARVIRVQVTGSGSVELDFAGSIQTCTTSCNYQAPEHDVPALVRIRAVPGTGGLRLMTPKPCSNALDWCDWLVGPFEHIDALFENGGEGLVQVSVGGAGRVRVNPGNQVCTGNCNYYFSPATFVSLSAESTGGSFNGWAGHCSGSNALCTVTAHASLPRIITASFGNSGPIGPLNDTGIDSCANASNNNLTCPQASFPDQDGDHGRDAQARAGQLTKIGGGEAGFDYTKISNSGNPLPAGAALGSGANDWGCTRDNLTGLIWEVKVNNATSLRHMNHTYTWYNTNTAVNGGNAGGIGTAGTCNGTLTACNTSEYVAAVNAQGLCGANDWRMPTPLELAGILHYGRFSPSIDPAYFPNTSTSGSASAAWSGLNFAAVPSSAWNVLFSDTGVSNDKSYNVGIRLVRGGW